MSQSPKYDRWTMRSSFILVVADTLLLQVFTLLLFFTGECSSKINNDSKLRNQHYNDDMSHPTSSSSEINPRLIGLNVNGKMKCLLWNNPRSSFRSTLTPLFTSHDIDEGEGRCETELPVPSSISPSAVFATGEYSFRRDRWYGMKQIGMLFRWNIPFSLRNNNNNDNHNNDNYDSNNRNDNILHPRIKERQMFSFPTTLDITAGRSIPPFSTTDHKVGTTFIDSGNLRIGWNQNEYNYDNLEPWIQIGFDPDYINSNNNLIGGKRFNDQPLHLKFFLPLIRRRFDLQWTSRWNHNTNLAATTRRSRSSSMNEQSSGDPWWIPEVRLDPSLGTLSSENRYRNAYVGGEDRKYWTEFKLRLRTTVPTLFSSATNFGIVPIDDNDTQTASLRLDCSFITKPGEQNLDSMGPTITTARLDMTVVPSYWWRSVTETARLGFIHEQNHATNQ